MAECVYCERSGWLLAVDGRGLCNDCARQVGPAIDENISIMQSSYKVAASAKTITMKLSRLEDCRLALENLVPFAEAGIPTLATPPDELAEQIGVIYRSAAGEEVEAIIATAQDKSNAASTDAA